MWLRSNYSRWYLMKKKLRVVRSYLRTKLQKPFTSRVALEKWQQQQVDKHLQFVRKHSPYFRERLTKYQWEDLPYMNKTIMMEHFDSLNTKGIRKKDAMQLALRAEETREFKAQIGDVTVGLSSGTSGNRGIFLVSEQEQGEWAGVILAKLLPRGLFSREKIAFFLRANSNLYESVKSRTIQFSFFDLLEPLSAHVERLNKLQPTIIVAPPSLLRMLASAKRAGDLQVTPIKMISVAEVLEPVDKKYIEDTFNLRLDIVYQATEGFIAHTCSYGKLHLNEDIMLVEKKFLDNDKIRFSPVITDFRRTTQPMIRYELNDILTLSKEVCSCGSVMTPIESIEGRSDDIFRMPSKRTKENVLIFPDFIRRAVMAASDKIEEYRVIQKEKNLVVVQLKVNQARELVQQQVDNQLQALFQTYGIQAPTISFHPYEEQPKLKKLKRIESLIH